jgi:signal transduction histidine kinase/ActR/RegA family two-component response regulator
MSSTKPQSLSEKDLEEIAALVTDNPDQERRIIRVSEVYVPGRLEELVQEKESGTLRSDPIAQARAYTKQVLDAMDAFSVAEYELRAQRSARQTGLYQAVIVLVPVFSALIAIVLSYAGWRQIGRSSEQFAAALAKAEEANLAKDNFLATVSHELRNPLNAIVLLASILLSDQEVHEGARQRVKAIDRAARTQAQLIDDLLDVSRIKSGRLRLDVQATDLAKVVKAAVDSMRVTAEAKAIALHDIVDTSVAVIAGDPKRLEQVVWNLLSNAIKFTPKGGKVQVRLERINSHVEIIVADNGQGIAPSSVPYVFDRFWQETESGRSRSGVGLGLSIVKELVALHGGTVMAHSDGIGKGSTFTVRLPLPPATAPLLEPRRHPTVAPADNAATASRLDGFSILVVDDEPEACEALTKLLGSLGATVYAENSVEAALRMLDRTRPDAIVADIEMPVHDGFFFAREVRNREQDRRPDGRVPLIALTAYGRIDDKVKILASGFESHVVKPVDLAELSATIRSLVAARAA